MMIGTQAVAVGRAGIVISCLTALAACGGDESRPTMCIDGDETCGASCSVTDPCEAGLFCSPDGTCAKQCVLGMMPCANGGTCTPSGSCIGGNTGGSGGAGGFGNSGFGGGPIVDNDGSFQCADTAVRASRVIPTVILLVDQSSSMDAEFGDEGTRWDVLRDFLLDEPDGLISGLQDQVRFGFALYSATSGGTAPDPIGECPMITKVDPDLSNFDAIASVYRDADMIEDTPTGDSIDAIVNALPAAMPDAVNGPTAIILATDGEPDTCELLDPQEGQAEAIAAAQRAFSLGIRTFIIAVGDEVSEQHQQDMANAGLGRAAGDEPAEFWTTEDGESLRAALTEIVSQQLSCEVALNGRVESGDACDGRVVLNGAPLGCDDANGWQLVDPQTIRLLGSACDELKSGAEVSLDVSFPCNVGFVD
jgi:hypothetical protein